MKSKKRISKLLISSLLSYGLSNCGINNVNVVRGMEENEEVDLEALRAAMAAQRARMNRQRNQMGRHARDHIEQMEQNQQELNQWEPSAEDITTAERHGLQNIKDRFFRAVQSLQDIEGRIDLNDMDADAGANGEAVKKIIANWNKSVCFGEWKKINHLKYPAIIGANKAGYDEAAPTDHRRPLDGARRYCCCGRLLNSRFRIGGNREPEIPGSVLPHRRDLTPGGLAQGESILLCGHIAHDSCVHRSIIFAAVSCSIWGHGTIDYKCPQCDRSCWIENQNPLVQERIDPNVPAVMWFVPDDRSLELPDQIHGNAPGRVLWEDRIRTGFRIPADEKMDEEGIALRRAQHALPRRDAMARILHRERVEREERERVERERLERERLERERLERERVAREEREKIPKYINPQPFVQSPNVAAATLMPTITTATLACTLTPTASNLISQPSTPTTPASAVSPSSGTAPTTQTSTHNLTPNSINENAALEKLNLPQENHKKLMVV